MHLITSPLVRCSSVFSSYYLTAITLQGVLSFIICAEWAHQSHTWQILIDIPSDETALNNPSTSYVIGRNSFALLKATFQIHLWGEGKDTCHLDLEEKSSIAWDARGIPPNSPLIKSIITQLQDKGQTSDLCNFLTKDGHFLRNPASFQSFSYGSSRSTLIE
eukprot:scaffold24052_cov94-Skeletonema_dohrnii-CCMP3373.AAC.3